MYFCASKNNRMSKRITITAALPYTNGPIHIGHLAGVYVPADIYARYLRLQGNDVAFICGSDEHGVPITIKAKKEGVTPQDVVDKYNAIIKQSFVDFGISFDNYSRTSAKVHHETASEFFKTLYDKGEFIEEVITGLGMPTSVSIQGDYVSVPDLHGRLVILDKSNTIMAVIGHNPDGKQRANFNVKQEDWIEGVFSGTHGSYWDTAGNLYVQDWNVSGRLMKLVRVQ